LRTSGRGKGGKGRGGGEEKEGDRREDVAWGKGGEEKSFFPMGPFIPVKRGEKEEEKDSENGGSR